MADTLLQGVLLGGLYALFALGLSLMFGVMRLTNVAHGDFIILGGYAGIALVAGLKWHFASVLLVLPIAFAVGFAVQKWVLNGTLGRDPLPSLVVTFGLSIVIQNGLLEIFSGDPRSIEVGGLNAASINLGSGIAVGIVPLLVFAVALLWTGALQWLSTRTSLGRAFRAVSDDREIAELMGLDAHKIYAVATGLAFIVIATGGILQAIRTTVSPGDGPQLLLFAFEAVIIGGLGSFWGTFLGALLLGIVQEIGFRVDPGWGIWAGHVAFLGLLVLRPQGLFPKTRG